MMHLQPDPYWEPLMKLMGLQHLIDEPKFNDMAGRAENSAELVKIMDEVFATRTGDVWDRAMRDSDVDFIYAMVQSVTE